MSEPQTVGQAVAEVQASAETWPKRFLIFSISYRGENIGASSQIITVHEEAGYKSAQEVAEEWFEDHSVMRIYELRQMFGIGRFRG